MVARTVEELLVYQKALKLWGAVNAILKSDRLQQDLRLHAQLRDAADSVVSNISEGFEQPTDKAFARYLFIAKASAAEIRTRSLLATKREYIPASTSQSAIDLSDQVAKMCVGLAKYLANSNRKRRGLGQTSD